MRAATLLKEYRLLGQRPFSDHAFVVLKSVEQQDTQWSIVYNIPRRVIFLKTKAHRRYKIISLEDLDFSCQSPVFMLSVLTGEAGNLSRKFIAYDRQKNRDLLGSVFRELADLGELDAAPPDETVLNMASYPDSYRCRENRRPKP